MKYQELMQMPTGTIFYEDDLPAMPLFQIVEVLEDDIIARDLTPDFENGRMGFREMTYNDKHSKRYKIFTAADLDTLGRYVDLAELSVIYANARKAS